MSTQEIHANSPSVLAHISAMQAVIQRMADYSRSCKLWCVTLVSATLVLIASMGNGTLAWLALIPVGALGFLDVYYLSLEQRFRNSYNDFVCKLHDGSLDPSEVFVIKPRGGAVRHIWRSTRSTSVLPFYLALAVVIVVVTRFV